MTGAAPVARMAEMRLRTPEGVSFSLRLASPLLRMVALLIDWGVVTVAWGLVAIVMGLLELLAGDFARGATVVLYFLLSQGYRVFTEWAWRGQTLGKRLMKLRVVDARGLRLTLSQVLLRNILRFVDALPGAYAVGGVAALLSARGQRLGDLVAGTLVVWEQTEPSPDLGLLGDNKYNSLRGHAPVVARLRQAVSAKEARVAWQALRRREQLEDRARLALFGELAAHFRAVTKFPPETVDGLSDEQFVRNVVDVLLVK
ncbi:RDD family protein [Actomonas aquatica]|uniref:RDD family protein n=1 Tax=Actomonas aquatica TaxID=2866162 RepID=A0ABZ1C7U4_9BACT|nr:RDD family protein [Opitutus sp. WL0086]WRQ86604.1 RDD family protein [Opitutus sp. WL0086]